jgi:hypothetical protein
MIDLCELAATSNDRSERADDVSALIPLGPRPGRQTRNLRYVPCRWRLQIAPLAFDLGELVPGTSLAPFVFASVGRGAMTR